MDEPISAPVDAAALAFDIGTTTVVGALARAGDKGRAEVIRAVSAPNPQSKWGADVVSRVNATLAGPDALAEMRGAVIGAINDIIAELDVDPSGVSCVALAGNPVMEHVLLGLPVTVFAKPPFRPSFKEARSVTAGELGLKLDAKTPAYVFPLIGGFVGGDAVAAALSIGLGADGDDGAVVAIDIGTNTEILVKSPGGLFATSAAAGPAFEGGNVSRGMTAGRGAISGVRVDGETLSLDVVGNVAPTGICGSGLIDAAAVMLASSVLEPSGRIRDASEIDTNLSARIKPGEGRGGNSFVLFRGASGVVELTQDDVRALQTAKAAIRAGISVLLDRAGVAEDEVSQVFLAGAFGAHLNPASLAAIGVIPGAWTERAVFSGDAALDGAASVATSAEARTSAELIAANARYVPLSGSAHFEDEFIRRMDF